MTHPRVLSILCYKYSPGWAARRCLPRTPRMHRSDAPAPHLKRRLMSATVIMSRALYTYSCPLAQLAVNHLGRRGNYYYKGLRICGAEDSPGGNSRFKITRLEPLLDQKHPHCSPRGLFIIKQGFCAADDPPEADQGRQSRRPTVATSFASGPHFLIICTSLGLPLPCRCRR